MRVTQGMLTNNMLRNLSKSYSNLGTYMDQLSTGKKVNRPSDDPVVVMKGMGYRSQVIEVEQYERNLSEVHNWMDNTDSSLDKATKALQRLRELAVQASNGTYEENQRESIKAEVDQLKEHLLDIANTKVNNKYIFNGTATTGGQNGKEPVYIDETTGELIVSTNDQDVLIEVSSGVKIPVNVDATQVFGKDMFDKLEAFSTALDLDDQDAIQQSISDMDSLATNVVNVRADLGARMNRVDLIEDRLSSQVITAERMMSDNEDIDAEEVIMNLTTQESIHRAALSAGSRVIQPTLMDFLR
ncbi:flagellar hook-associated protein FlgL [Radiobacillus deserti]|uniref:Flagellar hook-associated protein FlgL n=1 Tax=Radiobacillus deserti TaxID=2594883 RepID=A0A516KIR7_9BACI|nr:flagellar hook-associated protein FlgL [Radiobacillus deserti]QDP41282.1 flagellar hook-associated protein FlgL [Radiobacillus deserti]